MVVWPERDGELAAFMQRLATTHVRRWQLHRGRVGYGHVYQPRFKSFPVETDEYSYQVVRYVERNALRAQLAEPAQAWRWSSSWRQVHGTQEQRAMLSSWPVPRPRDWSKSVNEPQTETELQAIRQAVRRWQPYGSVERVERTAKRLGLESTLRAPHRTWKQSEES